ncbi:hypothetical protein BDN70DRAFT_916320 [Pholiota conissans]|uniref:DASH complex subunit ASK1 n=1 Tax=Pholiota conissans TaxID=109636 RepID=A0A9P6D891_9AGAR|nr:hypothetical protein BDN70DRAFT_916320 [Pholiota conissans]
MSTPRKPVLPNPPRWAPNPDPASIVVPGLNTEASTTDQIEQIEQLITIKLQNIDENFSKIHHALATKLLPAVKRYAVGTEPVREAAKFWTSFYEQAAQIRIPSFDDYSTINENPSEREETETSSQGQEDNTPRNHTTRTDQQTYETSTVNSETSFLPGQGAFSSTPAMSRLGKSNNGAYQDEVSEQPSWAPSLESPLVRLGREINNFSDQTDDSLIPSQSGSHATNTPQQDATMNSTFRSEDASILPASEKGKGKDTSHPLLRNVLRHNLYSASDNSTFENKPVSPLKFRKPKTPVVDKKLNPYLSAEASSAQWSGVVDLRDPSVLTPQKRGKSTKPQKATTPYDDEDDSFDGLPPGMSPPVLMSPARPPRSSAALERIKLGQTPARDATARIQRDLLRDAQYKSGGGNKATGAHGGGYYDSSMSTVPTPPSLSRYQRENDYSNSSNLTKDSSLESMIQRIRNDIRPDVGNTPGMTTPGLRIRPRIPINSEAGGSAFHLQSQNQQSYSPGPSEPATPMYNQMHALQDDLDDSLDLEEVNNTAHPSAAFLMASQGIHGQYDDDNSFDSNNSVDSLADEDVIGTAGLIPIHPFAQTGPVVEDDGFDDDDDESFDGFETQRVGMIGVGQYDEPEEETLFGLAPGQRMAQRGPTGELRMLGDDLLQDTIGIGTHIASSGRMVDESPTPASWSQR